MPQREAPLQLPDEGDSWESSLLPPRRAPPLRAQVAPHGMLQRAPAQTSMTRVGRASMVNPRGASDVASTTQALVSASASSSSSASASAPPVPATQIAEVLGLPPELVEALKIRAAATFDFRLPDEEDTWESALLPARRVLPARARSVIRGSAIPVAPKAAVRPKAAACAPEDGPREARLVSLHMRNFKCFEDKTVSFEHGACLCVVGPNSSGKSSILDAIKFVTLQESSKNIRGFVRRCRPAVSKCIVSATFEVLRLGKVVLERQVILDGPKEHRVTYAVALEERPLRELSETKYAAWLEKLLFYNEIDVVLNQFSLMEGSSVTQLLAKLANVLHELQADTGSSAPRLKRRAVGQSSKPIARNAGVEAEAWVARRLDEIYRELSRDALDEHFETWGDGGQASLRRLQDGSFTILVSRKRGLAATGYGSPLEELSDGDRDLCALALLLILPALRHFSGGLQSALPPLVMLDEPDSRLDKRGACCLWRLLSGPQRPGLCLLTSLNNHQAFTKIPDSIELPELVDQPQATGDASGEEDDPYGDVPLSRKRSCQLGVPCNTDA